MTDEARGVIYRKAEVRTSQVCACQLAERLSRLEERFEYVCRENGFWDGT